MGKRAAGKGKAKRTGQPAGRTKAAGKTSASVASGALDFRLPRWLPPVLYALVTIILFREFFFGDAILFGSDTYATGYFARELYTEAIRSLGQYPLWDPYLFGGLPFIDGMHGDIFYPPSLALFFLDARAMWGWKMVLHVFFAGCFAYLWLRGLRISALAALIGGLVFMAGPDLVSLVFPGGDGKLFVSALAPLVFWLTDRAVKRRRIGDYAAFALGLALVIFTSHMQLAYFTVWGVSLYFLFRVVQTWRRDRDSKAAGTAVGTFALAGVLAVSAAAIQFLPPLQYLAEWSHRAGRTVQAEATSAYQYSTTWSLHPEEAMSLVVPEFVGDDVASATEPATYWGRNAFKLNHEYAGLLPLLLLPLLLVRRRTPETWFFIALGLLAVVYGLGANTPFFRLFYLIPGVKLFRSPSLTIFLYGLSAATLAAFGLDRLLSWLSGSGEERRLAKRTLWITAAVFGFLAILASSGALIAIWQAIFDAPIGQAAVAALDANRSHIQAGFFIAFFLALAVAGAAELAERGLLAIPALIGALALVAVLDVYRVDRKFIQGTITQQLYGDPALFEPDDAIRFLQDRQADGEVFRVLDLGAYGSNVLAVHDLEQALGHHGNEIGRYRALMGGESAANLGASQLGLLNLLNVEYLTSPTDQPIAGPGLEEAFVGSRSIVYRNLNALPRAFLVGTAQVAPDEQALSALVQPGVDYESAVLLAEPLPAGTSVEPGASGTVDWQDRQLNGATLHVVADAPAVLVVTDNYYPAWRAWVDGQPTPILRADLTFRAVPVPAGEHTVRFAYSADSLRGPMLISAASLSALLLVVVLSAVRTRRSGGASTDASTAQADS